VLAWGTEVRQGRIAGIVVLFALAAILVLSWMLERPPVSHPFHPHRAIPATLARVRGFTSCVSTTLRRMGSFSRCSHAVSFPRLYVSDFTVGLEWLPGFRPRPAGLDRPPDHSSDIVVVGSTFRP
jgi:hypothetical protein